MRIDYKNMITLRDVLEKYDNTAISLDEIRRISGIQVVAKFHDLVNYKNFDQLFSELGNRIIIILMSTNNFGHFCILMKQNVNTVTFYESYGMNIDKLINISPVTRDNLRGKNPLVTLANGTKYKVDMNKYDHQKMTQGVEKEETCAYHVSFRSKFPTLSNDEYDHLVQSTGLLPDYLVILAHFSHIVR